MTLGVDVGGTFTDIVSWDGSALRVGKTSTTTEDQSIGVIGGATDLVGDEPHDLIHGTTVATNALLERRGARTALVTDVGFEDVIEIGRQQRPSLYDSFADRSPPLVDRSLRFGVEPDRIDHLVDELESAGVEAVAIGLIDAYGDGSTERDVGRAVAERLNVPLSLSSAVVGEFREYERISTTVLNAFLTPEVDRYLRRLSGRASEAGLGDRIAVMRSSGGLISVDAAAELPVSILLSGPAGGVVATAALGSALGYDRLISFDMGGTSTDVCRIDDGRPSVSYAREIGGYACQMPSVAIHTVGAGGGSVGWVDEGGALRVGPRSAGAMPGPACYGRGGVEATVTDANLVLGRIDPAGSLAGSVPLRPDLAHEALERLGAAVGRSAEETALGMVTVVESHMSHAIRSVSVEQGVDPRRSTLVAFGGAGGLHVGALAKDLAMERAVVPPYAGVFSALGLLLAPPRADAAETVNLRGDDRKRLEIVARDLLDRTVDRLQRDAGSGAEGARVVVDLRYEGQAHETSVPYVIDEGLDALLRRFHDEHRIRNGFARPEDAVEVVTVRAEATGRPVLDWHDLPPFRGSGTATRPPRTVMTAEGPVEAAVWWRPGLESGSEIVGPAVVEDTGATVYLAPGERAAVHPTGALVVSW